MTYNEAKQIIKSYPVEKMATDSTARLDYLKKQYIEASTLITRLRRNGLISQKEYIEVATA